MATAFTDQDDYYNMDVSRKGICLIINNFEFERSRRLDTGPADGENITSTFEKMDFETRYFENCSCKEMIQLMKYIQKEDHSNYNCFVCCITSHGNTKGVCGTKGYSVTIETLQSYVYSTQCPSLAGKPKVFFVDACRGKLAFRGLYMDQVKSSFPTTPVVIGDKRDFLVSFATTPNNVAHCNKDPTKGSVYFYHLTRLLNHFAESKTIMQILHRLNAVLTQESLEGKQQTAECCTTLAKELCFYGPNGSVRPVPRMAHRFHDNHGQCIVLSKNQQTAVYEGVYTFDGIVMSRDPIEVNKLYEVHITKRGKKGWKPCVGVVTSSPDRLTVPHTAKGWVSAVAVYCTRFFDHGDERVSDVGKALVDLPVDSRVGLSLDPSRRLHLHVNGPDQGVVPCRPLPDQCWAMWELDTDYPELTCLPVRDLS